MVIVKDQVFLEHASLPEQSTELCPYQMWKLVIERMLETTTLAERGCVQVLYMTAINFLRLFPDDETVQSQRPDALCHMYFDCADHVNEFSSEDAPALTA